jgi:hypothetical protein
MTARPNFAEFPDGYDAAIACDRLARTHCHLLETSDPTAALIAVAGRAP